DDCHSNLLWTAAGTSIRLTRDAHQPSHRLDEGVVAWAVGIRAALAEPGDRAVDESRIQGPERGVVESVSLEAAELVILDQHVGASSQSADDFSAFRSREVHRHGAFAAVATEEIGC